MISTLGSNGSGQLGLGHTEDVHSPETVQTDLPDSTVKSIAAGGNHTLLLLDDGSLFVTGESRDGRCGAYDQETDRSDLFRPISPLANGDEGHSLHIWKLCAATWEASILVSAEDRVYTCGVGRKGELGLGEGNTDAHAPTLVPNFPPAGLSIVDLAASMSHAVAVLSDGSVYGWGSGKKGQLGEPYSDCWAPRLIDRVPFRATKAVCGRDFTLIAGSPEGGDFLVFGSDKWGAKSMSPGSIAGWKSITATWGSILVLLRSGQLLSWGRDDHGQLGPQGLPPLEVVAAGSEHVLALSDADEVLAWGWGEHGNCGRQIEANGDVKGRFNKLTRPVSCIYLAAGCATSWIVCE